MSKPYRSPYEAYPFLRDEGKNLACDFELATDAIASGIGLLCAKVQNPALQKELQALCALVYHANPTLRTAFTVTEDEIHWLLARLEAHRQTVGVVGSCFVLPLGCEAACIAHGLRVDAKALVRLLYRHTENGCTVPEALLDFCNLLSGYFFHLAMVLNKEAGVAEITFESRNY